MYRHCESRKARGNLPYCFLVKLVSLVNLGFGASLNSLYSLFSLNSLSLAPKLFSYCKFSKKSPTIMQLWKINYIFVFELRNTQFLQMAFRLLLLISKTTKLLLRTHNRHNKCSRLLAWVCLCSYRCLVVPSYQQALSTLLLFQLSGCYLTATTLMFNYKIKVL